MGRSVFVVDGVVLDRLANLAIRLRLILVHYLIVVFADDVVNLPGFSDLWRPLGHY